MYYLSNDLGHFGSCTIPGVHTETPCADAKVLTAARVNINVHTTINDNNLRFLRSFKNFICNPPIIFIYVLRNTLFILIKLKHSKRIGIVIIPVYEL